MKLIVIGISGITGGGKTTLATRLLTFLSIAKNANIFPNVHINNVILINQDTYFYARDSPNHQWIPEINFINREILSAMDMDRFAKDIAETVENLRQQNAKENATIAEIDSSRIPINILLVEGFLIYNDQRINQYCQLRFHIYLSYEVALKRRLQRTFKHINPNPQWYFEHFIWKSYHKHLNEVPNKSDLIYLNGEQSVDDVFNQAHNFIAKFIESECKL